MTILLRVWAIFVVAVKRLYAQKGLTLATLLGLVVTIALTLSIPLYADAIYFSVLRQELLQESFFIGDTASRSPFAFMFRYIGDWHGPLSWEDIQPLDEYLTEQASSQLGLPHQFMVRYFKTDKFRFFAQEDIGYADIREPLAWVDLGYVGHIEEQITLVEGSFPAIAAPTADSTIEVLISNDFATKLGLQVGETFILFSRRTVEDVEYTTQIPIRISGIWQASDGTDIYWFYTPKTFEDMFLVPEETFHERISPYMEYEISLALWYMVLDGSDVHAPDAGPLLNRIQTVQQKASALLPETRLDVSPATALRQYQLASTLLTVLLYAFSAPIIALILTFVGLVVTLSVSRQRNEIAILRSRGATTSQVVSIAILEGLLMGGVALAIGLPLGEFVAQIMSQTQSFLNFSNQANLRIETTATTLRFGLLAVGLALAAQTMPTLGAARHTIISYKQTQARSMRAPFWQRIWLDILLLIPAAYGTFLLRQQGSIVLQNDEGIINNTPFQNPLLLVVPALGILALTLLFLRILPYVMAFLAWLLAHFKGVSLLLATRQLARTPGFYTAPMILLILTLSMSIFTASLAQTLDNHLFDQSYYKVGADMSLVDYGENSIVSGSGSSSDSDSNESGTAENAGTQWLFLPVTEYLKLPHVQGATRIGEYEAFTQLSGERQNGTFVGLDAAEFLRIAFWRWDFAPTFLAELMNALAIRNDGILLPRTFMKQYALNVGDTIQVSINPYGERVEMQLNIVGGFDLFPTWYPEDGPFFVGNLDYFFEQAQGQFPYDVWLKTEIDADYGQIVEATGPLGLRILNSDSALARVVEEQQRPERQGLFGLLSVGFSAAALFTVLGFVLYAFFSFRQRFIELGILRAVGLSSGQMTIFLAWELAFLILAGIILGTLLGVWASQIFIPFLQVEADSAARIPPFLVEIAWPAILRIYLLFGLMFFIALAGLATLLLRMKIFQAIKLGETV